MTRLVVSLPASSGVWVVNTNRSRNFCGQRSRWNTLKAAESPWADREKYPAKFDIDELRCIYCGMCEEACPVDAIELTSVYDIVGLTRQEMIFDKSKLLRVYDETVKTEPI